MKKLIALFAAFAALELVAGFANNLDTSGFNDIPDECLKLNGINCGGFKDGNKWVPMDISFDANGTAKIDGNGFTGIPTLDDYVTFGTYDDQSSIEAFFNRGEYLDARGEVKYSFEDLTKAYTDAETANFEKFEEIVEQVQDNLADYLAKDARDNGGQHSAAGRKAMQAWAKFMYSFETAKSARGDGTKSMLSYFQNKLKNAATDIEKKKYLNAANAAINTANLYEHLDARVTNLEKQYNSFLDAYADDMNTVSAYLGSTNAMAYFSSERGDDWKKDDAKVNRWMKFSTPDKIDDNYGFGSSQIGGRQWNFVFDTFASTYSMWAWPLVDDGTGDMVSGFYNFMTHYNLTGMTPRYNGFYEQIDNVKTNWYAKNITAPYNWADGTSIIVTNGQFKVKNLYQEPTTPWHFYDGKIKNCAVQVGRNTYYYGGSSYIDYTVQSPGTYYCHVTVPDTGSPSVSINTTSSSAQNQFTFQVATIISSTNDTLVATYELGTMPVVLVYE